MVMRTPWPRAAVVVLSRPDAHTLRDFLDTELASFSLAHRLIQVVGRCRVEYRGRAESTLDWGDRVVMLKPDGTLLIHNPAGLKPVNWQPPGCRFRAFLDQALVALEARRKRPAEVVQVMFDRVEMASSLPLQDGATLALTGTEFDVRDALRAHPGLVEEGFVPWARERQSERGPMDLYGEDRQGRRVVVEVKRTRAGIAEATQLWRYVEQERRKRSVDVRGILVAPAASERARLLLRDHGLEFREVSVSDLLGRQDVALGQDGQRDLLSFSAQSKSL